jgi:hypothetical protein
VFVAIDRRIVPVCVVSDEDVVDVVVGCGVSVVVVDAIVVGAFEIAMESMAGPGGIINEEQDDGFLKSYVWAEYRQAASGIASIVVQEYFLVDDISRRFICFDEKESSKDDLWCRKIDSTLC